MLGEIFGRRAGLNMLELTLFRFLGLRAPLGSPLLLPFSAKPGLMGDATALSMGLGLADMDAPGVLSGPNLGVFRADNLGVSSPSS
jgi:hypothetical protein